MKAMILAAGLGTRLLPFSETTPKPLFTIAGRPILDRIICSLQSAGCEAVIINTHHLHRKIEAYISGQNYEIPVYTRYEPVILGTGGAIKNVADFWDHRPFMVINSDIFTDIDLRAVYAYHLSHSCPASLVLYDDPAFNTVSIDSEGFVSEFRNPTPGNAQLTFTGIQVIAPEILAYIKPGLFSDIIEAYRNLMSEGKKIKAFVSKNFFWNDLGTPERYRDIAIREMTAEAFGTRYPEPEMTLLKGDGSDRKWYRLSSGNDSLILGDHGIRQKDETSEADAFVNIGRHLYGKGIPVPKICLYDTFSGLVFLEDLGDMNLQTLVLNSRNTEDIISCYKDIIDRLIEMSVSGAEGFDVSWTYQTPFYDKNLILERECRYFTDAFLTGYLGMSHICFEDFENEFVCLADKTMEYALNGFMHRDMQSRNIMLFLVPKPGPGNKAEGSRSQAPAWERKFYFIDLGSRSQAPAWERKFHFIDFQGGRIGPIQYDLASLLIDPYTDLPVSVQSCLLDYGIGKYTSLTGADPEKFRKGFDCCRITRNLQILGAFGYLSRVKGKTYFEHYIPVALNTLKQNLSEYDETMFVRLKNVLAGHESGVQK